MPRLRVAILHDPVPPGAPPDQQDTLVQAQSLASALDEHGFECLQVPFQADLTRLSSALHHPRSDVVFNLVESVSGYGDQAHLAPAWLEAEGIPFTGAGSACMMLTGDKQVAKRWMQSAGIPVPPDFDPAQTHAADARFIVKSRCEDASIGLDAGSVVPAAEVAARIEACRQQYGGDWFAEQYIEGREFNIALLQDQGAVRVLPPAEIVFHDFAPGQPRIVDYRAKWAPESFEYRNTQRVFPGQRSDGRLLRDLATISKHCWRLFGLKGYARVDFRVDQHGHPWVLEVNANPCLSPDAGFAAALEQAGIGYAQAAMMILDSAHSSSQALPC